MTSIQVVALAHPARVDPVAQAGTERRQLDPVVAAEHLGGVLNRVGDDRAPSVHE